MRAEVRAAFPFTFMTFLSSGRTAPPHPRQNRGVAMEREPESAWMVITFSR
jgi:hypothetical protein